MAVKLFFAYSHVDEGLRDQLEVHLASLKRLGQIDMWHDRRIDAGDVFDSTISAELEDAKIILLLISPDFIASRYCYDIETTRALERHEEKTARVIPVILRPCDWQDLPFGKLLALPTDGKAITVWADIDEAFLSVVKGIKRALKELGVAGSVQHSETKQAVLRVPDFPEIHSGQRSPNLRITKSLTDQDRDDFLHEAFAYFVNFFQNSLAELSQRNPGIEGRLRRSGDNRFSAAIYQGGNKVSSCTVYISQDYGSGQIRFSHGERDTLSGWNEALSVDCDDQALFLRPMGMMAYGNQGNQKLSKQGGAELFWGALIGPLQR